MENLARRIKGEKVKKSKKTEVTFCKRRGYGCISYNTEKRKARKSEFSKYYMLNGKFKEEKVPVMETYLTSIAILETGRIGKLVISWSRKYDTF